MKKQLLLFCFSLGAFALFAQEDLGIANSNYAGVNGIRLNPSSMVDSWAYMDIHLVGSSLFADNNYVYLSKDEFSFWNDVDLSTSNNTTSIPEPRTNESTSKKNGIVDAAVYGPSFMISHKNSAFGFHMGVRTYTNINNISPELARFMYNGLTYTPQHGINFLNDKFRVNTMSWGEIGLSYGTIVYKQEKNMITAAGTIKKLIGLQAVSINVENVDYEVIDTTDLQVNDITAQYGFGDIGFNSGKGWGGDIGFTYKRMKEDVTNYVPHSQSNSCDHIEYNYKIGVSLIDIGAIKFTNATYGGLNNSSAYWGGYDSTEVDGIEGADSLIHSYFSNVVSGSEFKSTMPMAVSIQYDQNLGKGMFINFTAVHGITGVKKMGLHRSSIIGITPRYETKRFEVAVPISVYEFQRPHVGLAFRFNSVIIGSDNIAPFFIPSNIYGADIYFAVKYTIFKSSACKGKHKKEKRKEKNFVARNESYPCPLDE